MSPSGVCSLAYVCVFVCAAFGQSLHDTGIGFIQLASGVHNQELFTAMKHVGEAAEAVGKDEMERVRSLSFLIWLFDACHSLIVECLVIRWLLWEMREWRSSSCFVCVYVCVRVGINRRIASASSWRTC